ncbi:MAG: F0F1 ATP synthase subunit B [Anaerolineales bacterium]|nr:F0F1 ATP synthase subunit B [Chloroflexota bacterium]MBL6982238.1 F0F1 ATP synthase subunit B [Anaerolineales bacterium]
MDKLGVNLGFLIFQILNFAIVAILLYAWAYKPIVKMLEERKNKIAQGHEDARVAAEARENAEAEANKILAEAQAEANKIIQDATSRADKVGGEVKAEAEAEVAKMRDEATAEAAVERDRMLADMRGQIASLAIAAAQKLIGESIDEKRQHALINEFFSGVKDGKVTVLEGEGLSGASAEVTSAVPLTDKELDQIKKDVLAKVGDQATVTFRVDPSILGGLVLRIGDKVLDSSVSGQLEGLRQKLG